MHIILLTFSFIMSMNLANISKSKKETVEPKQVNGNFINNFLHLKSMQIFLSKNTVLPSHVVSFYWKRSIFIT